MIRLNVTFAEDFEQDRVRSTVAKLDWYNEQGYKVLLPRACLENISESSCVLALSQEFSLTIYEKYASDLLIAWEAFTPRLNKMLEKNEIVFKNIYTIILTKYGTGGSYDAALDEIILNITNRTIKSVLATLVHEMVHISIQSFVTRYSVSHWKKERCVDLLVEYYFSGLRPLQNIREDVSIVDSAFATFLLDRNIENLIKNIQG